jgi:sulfide dehydrogenase [flavocytochrome c] flavoprotein chain
MVIATRLLVVGAMICTVTASPAAPEPPPGASARSGCHPASAGGTSVPSLAGRNRADVVAAMQAFRSGWCPIDPLTFESKRQPNIHVLGDAAIADGMPKPAFAANAQGKVCAVALAKLPNGSAPSEPKRINTGDSLLAPNTGISIAGVYRATNGTFAEVEGSSGISPLKATRELCTLEATLANVWLSTIPTEVFG